MKKVWLAVVVVAMSLAIASPAAARTTKVAYECTATLTDLISPGDIWVEDGAVHMRGFQAVYDLVGDDLCAGTLTGNANFNLDLATWSGVVWGTSTIALDAYDGGFHARLVAHFTTDDPLRPDATDIWSGQTVRHGYGELEGWQAHGTLIEKTHVLMLDAGYAFEPGS
jgi:hypothetical protein